MAKPKKKRLAWTGKHRDQRAGKYRALLSGGAWTLSYDGKRISRHDSLTGAKRKAASGARPAAKAANCAHETVVTTWHPEIGQELARRCSPTFGCGAQLSLGRSSDVDPHVKVEMRAALLEHSSRSTRPERVGMYTHALDDDFPRAGSGTASRGCEAGWLCRELRTHNDREDRDATAWGWDVTRPISAQTGAQAPSRHDVQPSTPGDDASTPERAETPIDDAIRLPGRVPYAEDQLERNAARKGVRAMTPKIEPVRCVCGWRGLLALRADCRGCGANYTHRVSKERLAVLRAIGAREPGARAIRIEPQMRIWLVDHRLIVASEPPRPAREAPGRQRAPLPRAYRLTERGEIAIAEVATRELIAGEGSAAEGAMAS